MDLDLRAARAEDASAIVSLLDPIIRAGTWSIMDAPITAAAQVAFIEALPARSVYHVARERGSGRLVGVQDVLPFSAEPALAHVGAISTFVALDAHRRGVGQSLMGVTLPAAAARGFGKIMAAVRADNPGAVAFYRSQAFDVIGTARGHAAVRDRLVDEILMERLLPPAGG